MPGKPDLVHHPARDVQRPRRLGEQDPRLDRAAGGDDGRLAEVVEPEFRRELGGRLAEELRLRLRQIGRRDMPQLRPNFHGYSKGSAMMNDTVTMRRI